jgi:hypothetical protein
MKLSLSTIWFVLRVSIVLAVGIIVLLLLWPQTPVPVVEPILVPIQKPTPEPIRTPSQTMVEYTNTIMNTVLDRTYQVTVCSLNDIASMDNRDTNHPSISAETIRLVSMCDSCIPWKVTSDTCCHNAGQYVFFEVAVDNKMVLSAIVPTETSHVYINPITTLLAAGGFPIDDKKNPSCLHLSVPVSIINLETVATGVRIYMAASLVGGIYNLGSTVLCGQPLGQHEGRYDLQSVENIARVANYVDKMTVVQYSTMLSMVVEQPSWSDGDKINKNWTHLRLKKDRPKG